MSEITPKKAAALARLERANRKRSQLSTRDTSWLQQALSDAITVSGLRVTELAERAGYSTSTVSHYLTGAREGTMTVWSDLLDAAGVQISSFRITPQQQAS